MKLGRSFWEHVREWWKWWRFCAIFATGGGDEALIDNPMLGYATGSGKTGGSSLGRKSASYEIGERNVRKGKFVTMLERRTMEQGIGKVEIQKADVSIF